MLFEIALRSHLSLLHHTNLYRVFLDNFMKLINKLDIGYYLIKNDLIYNSSRKHDHIIKNKDLLIYPLILDTIKVICSLLFIVAFKIFINICKIIKIYFYKFIR